MKLLKYAKNYGHDITITKEGMYPEFILDGVEYSAMRISGRWHTVHCQMIHPELAESVLKNKVTWQKLYELYDIY